MNGILNCTYQGYLGLTNSGEENLDVVVHIAIGTASFGVGMGCLVAGQALEPAIKIFEEMRMLAQKYEPIKTEFQENQRIVYCLAKVTLAITLANAAFVVWRLNNMGCSHSPI